MGELEVNCLEGLLIEGLRGSLVGPEWGGCKPVGKLAVTNQIPIFLGGFRGCCLAPQASCSRGCRLEFYNMINSINLVVFL